MSVSLTLRLGSMPLKLMKIVNHTCAFIRREEGLNAIDGCLWSPACFADLTAHAFKDLLLELKLETFIDDNGMAGNDFEELLQWFHWFLERCRELGLSLSPSKLQLFMREVVFGGSRVGVDGIKLDIAKLETVAKWPQPANLLDLMRFLRLTGYFRLLIKDYARIVAPLTDLQRNLDMPQPNIKAGRRKYRQYLRDRKLDTYWMPRHDRAFIKLKRVLTSEPVLRAPKFDGTPFILTTDRCKDGFGAVLSQQYTTTLENGEIVTAIHPIGFASKRTSLAEEQYKPYILEFAALKFGLDHFSNTVWGFPVEIETDCIALRDTLCNDKLSLVHTRWRDSISAHQIMDVRHHPGKTNAAADALSCQLVGRERVEGDGSEWMVSEDWEETRGLVNDLFGVSEDAALTALQVRFKNKPLFLDVIGALCNTDQGKTE